MPPFYLHINDEVKNMVYLPDQVPFNIVTFRQHVRNEQLRLFDVLTPSHIAKEGKSDHRAYRWATLYAAAYPGKAVGMEWKDHRKIIRAYLTGEDSSLLKETMKRELLAHFPEDGEGTPDQVRMFEKDLSVYRLMEWKKNMIQGGHA